MMSERVILYPDPDQGVEHLWFEIGRYLGFQGIEDFRIVPNEDTSTTARLAAIGSHSHGLQGIELDATEAMIVKFRFRTITLEAYRERQDRRIEALMGSPQYLRASSLISMGPFPAGTTISVTGTGAGAITTITKPSIDSTIRGLWKLVRSGSLR